jgi:hypothetical protein
VVGWTGIRHSFIRSHRPTDQAAVERCHRTMDAFSDDAESRANLEAFQNALEYERQQHKQHFPSRASDCAGRPPLVAHPEFLQPRRPYQPEYELALFDMRRVYALLAEIKLARKVNRNGQITLKGKHYSVGLHFAIHLGGNDYLVQIREVLQSASEDLLTPPNGLDIGRIEEIDPQLEGFLDDRLAFFFVEHPLVNPTLRVPEPHATKADSRHVHSGIS